MTTKQKAVLAGKIIYTFIVVALLIGVIVAAFVLKGKWNLFSVGFADIGVYGAVIFVFLILQQIFSTLNNKYWIPKISQKANRLPQTSIQVVGYRQDPKLFMSCLTSLSRQNYANMNQIIVGIDGNQKEDQGMEQVFEEVFPNGYFLRLQKLYNQMDSQEKRIVQNQIANQKYVCISQPHKGKRQIMYTCFHCHSASTQLIALTDSDTLWEQDTLQNLVNVMVGHDAYREQKNAEESKLYKSKVKQCGAVTGDVRIWNKQNYLSFLSAIRYWFAFNVERAADSFFGVVNCVSGPLGLYKKHHIQEISEGWIEQTFMGQKCTFGDDRALSNRILERGMSIFYTPEARCQTDTPAELMRWIPQQTRWSKSFYREFVYNIRSFYKHSLWMSVMLVFQCVYPFFILATLVWFATRNLDLMLIVFSFIVIMGTLRSLFGLTRTCKFQFLHYSMYVFLYILFLVPCKLWALLTVWNSQWGTSSRSKRVSSILKAIHALIWAVLYSAYVITYLVLYFFVQKQEFELPTAIVAGSLAVYLLGLLVHWNTWGRFFLVPKVQAQIDARYVSDTEHNLATKQSHPTTQTIGNSIQNLSNKYKNKNRLQVQNIEEKGGSSKQFVSTKNTI